MKKILIIVLGIMLITGLPAGYSAAAPQEDILIPVSFSTPGMGVMQYAFPYSDNYFTEPGEVFSRDTAKASLGLMVSAFREKPESALDLQYETYLKAAGFQEIHAFGYDQPTAVDTLSGVIAHKQIGDFTLIAAAPAGQGYEKEWGGNLQLGTGERHEGFETAARIMERELDAYIQEHGLQGKLKLWITGFSRASAVANLTAADEIASGRFTDVYAYLYATPRTTRAPEAYPGIFNIVGQFDPVPQVPLESWGYGRYGTDLFLPAAETDIRFPGYLFAVSEVTWEMAHDSFRFNPELNNQMHLILEFLGEMFPTAEEYVQKLQTKIMGIWQEPHPDQIEEILLSVFSQLEELDSRQEYSSRVFAQYLSRIALQRMKDGRNSEEIRDLAWAGEQGTGANLMREHMPYIYASWILSELSDEELFGGSAQTRRVLILGNADVEAWAGDVFLYGITAGGGNIIYPDLIEQYDVQDIFSGVFMVRNGEETMICMPAQSRIQVRIKVPQQTDFVYYDTVSTPEHTFSEGDSLYIAFVEPGEYLLEYPSEGNAVSLRTEQGRIIRELRRELVYSPTMIMEMESTTNQQFTVQEMLVLSVLTVLVIAFILLICVIIAVIHAVRKKKHGPYSGWYVIIPHLLIAWIMVDLTLFVTANLYLITLARVALAAAGMLVLFLLALRGLLRSRNIPNLIIAACIPVLGMLNCLVYQKSALASADTTTAVIYCICMAAVAAAAAVTFRKKRTRHEPADTGNG